MKFYKFILCFCIGLTTYVVSAQENNFMIYDQAILGSPLSFKMVPIQGGEFTIGSAANEKGRNADEGPQKKLSISAFWMSAYEVTRDELDVFYKRRKHEPECKRRRHYKT